MTESWGTASAGLRAGFLVGHDLSDDKSSVRRALLLPRLRLDRWASAEPADCDRNPKAADGLRVILLRGTNEWNLTEALSLLVHD